MLYLIRLKVNFGGNYDECVLTCPFQVAIGENGEIVGAVELGWRYVLLQILC